MEQKAEGPVFAISVYDFFFGSDLPLCAFHDVLS